MRAITSSLFALLLIAPACGGDDSSVFGNGTGDGGGVGDGDGGGIVFGDGGRGDGSSGPCTGLQCQIHSCGGGGSTTISGTVYDPAGKNPLYGVVVYVPNSKPDPLPSGASCASCDSLYTGNPIAVGITDATGKFTIKNAPDGANIPLVVQVGKWRKQMVVPSVAQCADTALPDKTVTLPKNHNEGDIPNIAVSTGGADTLECLLSRIGVDGTEYAGGANGAGRIHIFVGAGGTNTSPPGPSSPSGLWANTADLMKYDIVLLSREGSETTSPNLQALHDYASAGGRVFASHFHYAWFNHGPYASENLATWFPGANHMNNFNTNIVTTLPNGQPFPKGLIFKQWLGAVGALGVNGAPANELPIIQGMHNADVTGANTPSQAWITADQSASPPNATEYFSFNTPTNAPLGDAGVPNYCGRVVFSDLHVGAASKDTPGTIPAECRKQDLSPQEKALEFMLFDLSSCVTPDNKPPPPPPNPK